MFLNNKYKTVEGKYAISIVKGTFRTVNVIQTQNIHIYIYTLNRNDVLLLMMRLALFTRSCKKCVIISVSLIFELACGKRCMILLNYLWIEWRSWIACIGNETKHTKYATALLILIRQLLEAATWQSMTHPHYNNF